MLRLSARWVFLHTQGCKRNFIWFYKMFQLEHCECQFFGVCVCKYIVKKNSVSYYPVIFNY